MKPTIHTMAALDRMNLIMALPRWRRAVGVGVRCGCMVNLRVKAGRALYPALAVRAMVLTAWLICFSGYRPINILVSPVRVR